MVESIELFEIQEVEVNELISFRGEYLHRPLDTAGKVLFEREGLRLASPAEVLFRTTSNVAYISWGGVIYKTKAYSIKDAMQRFLDSNLTE